MFHPPDSPLFGAREDRAEGMSTRLERARRHAKPRESLVTPESDQRLPVKRLLHLSTRRWY
jgi:hypothetical protein